MPPPAPPPPILLNMKIQNMTSKISGSEFIIESKKYVRSSYFTSIFWSCLLVINVSKLSAEGMLILSIVSLPMCLCASDAP